MVSKSGVDSETSGLDLIDLTRYFSERSPHAMVIVEGTTHIVRGVNRAFLRLVGKDRGDLIGRPFAEAVPEGENNRCLALLDRVYRTGEPEVLLEQEHAQTPPAYWSYSVWVILGADERPAGVMIQVMDATEIAIFRKRVTEMNEALMHSSVRQHELTETLERTVGELEKAKTALELRVRERTAELTESVEELRRSNRDLEQFAYVASHDLQEPLRMVTSFVQILEDKHKDTVDAEEKEYMDFVVEGSRRMRALIDDLLAYSQINAAARPFQPTDCEALLAEVLENLALQIEDTGAQVTHDPLPTVPGDRTQLMLVFQNLIGNALKFHSERPPRVHIGVEQKEAEWLFHVRDNGIGIPPDCRDKIFVIFQRLHARRCYAGNGMGLAICKRIIERHGGGIWVDSKPGEGSTFYFKISIN